MVVHGDGDVVAAPAARRSPGRTRSVNGFASAHVVAAARLGGDRDGRDHHGRRRPSQPPHDHVPSMRRPPPARRSQPPKRTACTSKRVQLVERRDPPSRRPAGGPPRRQRRSGPDRPPKRASMARSVSRCPPCAAGSTSHGRPSASHSRFPDHRSPWMRAGGSGGPARSASRSHSRSMTAAPSAGSRRPSRTNGRTRRSAQNVGQSSAGVLAIGSGPMKPRPVGAERRRAATVHRSPPPDRRLLDAAASTEPGRSGSAAMWSGPRTSTSGTGAPASSNHRNRAPRTRRSPRGRRRRRFSKASTVRCSSSPRHARSIGRTRRRSRRGRRSTGRRPRVAGGHRRRVELPQQPHLAAGARRRVQREQVALVLGVHGQQQVELLEVVRPPPGGRAARVMSTPRVRASAIDRRSGGSPVVPPGRARRVDDDGAVEAGVGDEPAHDALGRRRAADVAEAHEQHAVRGHRAVSRRSR